MTALKCLACGYDNKVGDELCAACSSSLNLQLCRTCEAINADKAEHCHSCGAALKAAPEVVVVEGIPVREAPPRAPALPSTWVISGEPGAARWTALKVAVWAIPVLAAAGMAYQLYGPRPASALAPAAPVAQASPVVVQPIAVTLPAPVVTPLAPVEPARPAPPPQPVEFKQAPPAPAPAFEPKLAPTTVTHTRAAPAAASAPVVRTSAAATAPASEAVAEPDRTVPRVTHTKAVEAPLAGAAAPSGAAAVGGTASKDCLASVSALGLCGR